MPNPNATQSLIEVLSAYRENFTVFIQLESEGSRKIYSWLTCFQDETYLTNKET